MDVLFNHSEKHQRIYNECTVNSIIGFIKINFKDHLCKIPLEDQSPYCRYIVVAMSNNLSDQITHAKVCSSYHYEQQKLKEKVMTQSC